MLFHQEVSHLLRERLECSVIEFAVWGPPFSQKNFAVSKLMGSVFGLAKRGDEGELKEKFKAIATQIELLDLLMRIYSHIDEGQNSREKTTYILSGDIAYTVYLLGMDHLDEEVNVLLQKGFSKVLLRLLKKVDEEGDNSGSSERDFFEMSVVMMNFYGVDSSRCYGEMKNRWGSEDWFKQWEESFKNEVS